MLPVADCGACETGLQLVVTAPLTITDMVTADYPQSTASIGTIHDRSAEGGRFDVGFTGWNAVEVVDGYPHQ